MKYVTLESLDGGMPQIVFCVAPQTHYDLAKAFAATHHPKSAGFCKFDANGRATVFGASGSLRLAPAVGDAELIEAMVRHTARMGERMYADATPTSRLQG